MTTKQLYTRESADLEERLMAANIEIGELGTMAAMASHRIRCLMHYLPDDLFDVEQASEIAERIETHLADSLHPAASLTRGAS